ncbi:hypothetical protein ACFYYH_18475 [Streptomyces sp. NPDC002018]
MSATMVAVIGTLLAAVVTGASHDQRAPHDAFVDTAAYLHHR